MSRFTFYRQFDSTDCGPACLRMIAKFYGKELNLGTLRELNYITREGISLLSIKEAAQSIGFKSIAIKVDYKQLSDSVPKPCIIHWNQNHFVVIYKVKGDKIYIADPGIGKIKFKQSEFVRYWANQATKNGAVLLFEPTNAFFKVTPDTLKNRSYRYILSYILKYKKQFYNLFFGLILGCFIQFSFPFLTQSIVDIGIKNNDLNFIYLILVAQLVLFISNMFVDFIRSWILLHISKRISISIVSDFLIKLMVLPINFYESKNIGDLNQRINDHSRIENFLTYQFIGFTLTFFTLIVFSFVLLKYSFLIFSIFILSSFIYIFWFYFFLNRRKTLDYQYFNVSSEKYNVVNELITGMQEIKLNQCEDKKRILWELVQAKLYKIDSARLLLNQYQQTGATLINETKNIVITIVTAYSVINDTISLGMMLSIQYMLGQLNRPLSQFIDFIYSAQDAKISFERMQDVYQCVDENSLNQNKIIQIPTNKDITIKNITFQYEGPHSQKVLNNITLTIPNKKVTAIVGPSGSGKTTLIKLLLGFYKPVDGLIEIGNNSLDEYSSKIWRTQCGTVLQDGYLFTDSIINNITLSSKEIDYERYNTAVEIANITEYIKLLPLRYNTIIGPGGVGLSQGQKQRILIARAVYKNPNFLFFDEATNSLDANNELQILNHLNGFFAGRTVVIVAHRLSTVKNAHQIIVLDKGNIIEIGNHNDLISMKGAYYNLIKNQLELDN